MSLYKRYSFNTYLNSIHFLTHNLGLNLYILGDFFYWVLRIMLLIPVYQVLLIVIGSIFGEFKYFWRIEKKMLGRFGIKFS